MVTANLVDQIKIFNNQSVATPATFQVMLTINPSLYSTFEKSDLGNIRFYSDSALTQSLNSWIESGSTNTSTSAIVWVKLTSAIAANSNTTIYMAFLSTTTAFDGVQAGQAPQLSSSYGANDNGTGVFTFYDGFAGAAINAAWNQDAWNAGDFVVNNGCTINTYDIPGHVVTLTAQQTGPLVVEGLQKTNDAVNGNLGCWFSSAQSGDSGIAGGGDGGLNIFTSLDSIQSKNTLAGPPPQPPLVSVTTNQVVGLGLDAKTLYSFQNYTLLRVLAGTFGLSEFPGLQTSGSIATVRNTIQWFRTRALPPNGMMPSAYRWLPTPANEKIRLGAGRFGQLGF